MEPPLQLLEGSELGRHVVMEIVPSVEGTFLSTCKRVDPASEVVYVQRRVRAMDHESRGLYGLKKRDEHIGFEGSW